MERKKQTFHYRIVYIAGYLCGLKMLSSAEHKMQCSQRRNNGNLLMGKALLLLMRWNFDGNNFWLDKNTNFFCWFAIVPLKLVDLSRVWMIFPIEHTKFSSIFPIKTITKPKSIFLPHKWHMFELMTTAVVLFIAKFFHHYAVGIQRTGAFCQKCCKNSIKKSPCGAGGIY